MTIRLMTMGDYEGVYELWMSCVGMGLNNLDDSKDRIEKFLLRNLATCFVAEEGGGIVGVILSGRDRRQEHLY